jgi:glyoxylase-like metal-dependent hydrolase (beta-lactamase superfamily II)
MPRVPIRIAVCSLFAVALAGAAAADRQQPAVPNSPPAAEPEVRKVSEHVWVIDGSKSRVLFPNVGIIVGTRATLVVDTGIGTASGEIVMREVKRLSSNSTLYLTYTHFHTEHVSGVQAFPANTILIYPEALKDDMDTGLAAHMARFSAGSPEVKELLQGAKPSPPNILFDHEAKIDLGGVTARLLYFGPGHTHGDNLIFVEEDGVLLPGDIVQVRMFPNISYRFDASAGVGPSATGWLTILDKIEALQPRIIVPDHGAFPADASWIGKERDYLQSLKSRVAELKKQGKSGEEAGKILTPEFQAKYPDWTPANAIAPAAQRFYSELP